MNKKIGFAAMAFCLFAGNIAFACTNFLITKGASKDGSTMITYAADSHTLYGELYYNRAAKYPAGTMIQVVDWDSGRPLVRIPQVAQTYTTVGNMNEWGLAIGETTYGGRSELEDTMPGIDYGSLIYISLQRSKNAREAIKCITELMSQYGYASSGESFSISDPDEVWILELIGKGAPVLDKKGKVDKRWKRGAVWVARRIPDGYISGHANHARITQFPQYKKGSYTSISSKQINEIFRPEVEVVYSEDVITFARLKGYYNGTDADFSFSDTYAPLDFSAARGCEARVYAAFLRCNKSMIKYEKYAMGYDLDTKSRMPLWIKPDAQLSVHDVMELMRDHYEGTPMDMTNDLGAGPFKCPYRWRPMNWSIDGKEYIHERATSTQQTGFSFVTQSRSWMPNPAKGILWFGVDDTYSTVYVPMYGCLNEVPECFKEGNGNMTTYSPTSAFWLFNQVTNFAYSRYCDMIVDIRKRQGELEHGFIKDVENFDKTLQSISDETKIRDNATQFSLRAARKTFDTWKDLSQYLLVKYIDGNVKKEKDGKFEESQYRKGQSVFPSQPLYRKEWYDMIIKDHGKVIAVPEGTKSSH
ncbi:MAG: C69 family dipeptidase [Bacteroidales bacterium]|jgi:dipeptidase|nr:C69 family dipeptidase [Bacteroidales bacterium]